jgi:hypothetical protein
MRYKSELGDRYIVCQIDGSEHGATDELRFALKTQRTDSPFLSSTWVYLSEKEALAMAAQIVQEVARSK